MGMKGWALTAGIGAAVLAVLTWLGIWCFETPVLTFFGADAELLPLAQTYLVPLRRICLRRFWPRSLRRPPPLLGYAGSCWRP